MNKNHYAFIDSQNLNLAILDQGWKLEPFAVGHVDFMNNLRWKLEYKKREAIT